jgi:hypothetical protein
MSPEYRTADAEKHAAAQPGLVITAARGSNLFIGAVVALASYALFHLVSCSPCCHAVLQTSRSMKCW